MKENIVVILSRLVNIEVVIGLLVVIVILMGLYPLLFKALKIIRRPDVVKRGALMTGVLSLAGSIMGLVIFILLVMGTRASHYAYGLVIFWSVEFLVIFYLSYFLNRKLYLSKKESGIIGLFNGLFLSLSLVFLFF